MLTEEKTKLLNEHTPKINTFGVCPINGLAGLLGRHLYTKQSPNNTMVEDYTALITPIIEKLADDVYNYVCVRHYGYQEHLEHYPPKV